MFIIRLTVFTDMPDWFQKVFEIHESHNNRKDKITLEKSGNKNFIKTSKFKYLAGTFNTDTLENIRKEAKRKAIAYLEMNKNRLPFDNKFIVYNLDNIEIMEEINDLVNKNACFQVASQTNCLEHPNKDVKPEDGITNYKNDHTQGPACAIAAAPGTYYRNYFVMPGNKPQTEGANQINTLYYLEKEINNLDSKKYFSIQNGYVTINTDQRQELKNLFASPDYQESNGNFQKKIVDKISVGIMANTEAIIGGKLNNMKFIKYEPRMDKKFTVTQIFCSAVNLDEEHGGNGSDPESNDILAKAILKAQYEATLWVAVINAINTGCNAVYLTSVGGGVFKNPIEWVIESINNAILEIQKIKFPLIVYIVHHSNTASEYYELENLSYDFKRNKHIYYDVDMNEVDDPSLDISLKELYKRIDKNYSQLDKLTKKVNKIAQESNGPVTFSSNQVRTLKKYSTDLDDMISML